MSPSGPPGPEQTPERPLLLPGNLTLSETASTRRGADSFVATTTNSYGVVGLLTSSTTTNTKNNTAQPTTVSTYDYIWRDGPLQDKVHFKPNANQAKTFTSTSLKTGTRIWPRSMWRTDGRGRSAM